MALNFLHRRTMKGEKEGFKNNLTASMSWSASLRIMMRLFQFVMGLVIIGLYAQDLDKARKAHKPADGKWVYATFTGAFGSLVSVIFALPLLKAWAFFYIDFLVFFFYLVAFGIFGKMYIKEDPEGNKGIIRMKHAVWVLATNMVLWVMTCTYGGFIAFRARNARTTHTGRSTV